MIASIPNAQSAIFSGDFFSFYFAHSFLFASLKVVFMLFIAFPGFLCTKFFHLLFSVIRCRDLCRANGAPVNAYVKVAIISDATTNNSDNGFQRTAVHRNSHRPYFDHRFTFDLCGNETARIQLAVWHRDREFK